MKGSILAAGAIICGISLSFCATPEQAQSSTASNSTNQANANASASTFTNAAGQSFTAEQLAENLKNLRSSIEQTLPMLNAVALTYSN